MRAMWYVGVVGALFDVADLDEVFGDLHGIEGGTFLDLVAAEPEGETVGVGQVLADAPDEDVVLTGGEQGHGIALVGGVVDDGDALGV